MLRILNSFGKEHEIKHHRPIFTYISNNLNSNIIKKISYKTITDIFIKTTYSFYDNENYVIFKLHISNIYHDDNHIFVDIEFTYSSKSFNYWVQYNNPILRIEWNSEESKKEFNLQLIKDFIQLNLVKNNYFDQIL